MAVGKDICAVRVGHQSELRPVGALIFVERRPVDTHEVKGGDKVGEVRFGRKILQRERCVALGAHLARWRWSRPEALQDAKRLVLGKCVTVRVASGGSSIIIKTSRKRKA